MLETCTEQQKSKWICSKGTVDVPNRWQIPSEMLQIPTSLSIWTHLIRFPPFFDDAAIFAIFHIRGYYSWKKSCSTWDKNSAKTGRNHLSVGSSTFPVIASHEGLDWNPPKQITAHGDKTIASWGPRGFLTQPTLKLPVWHVAKNVTLEVVVGIDPKKGVGEKYSGKNFVGYLFWEYQQFHFWWTIYQNWGLEGQHFCDTFQSTSNKCMAKYPCKILSNMFFCQPWSIERKPLSMLASESISIRQNSSNGPSSSTQHKAESKSQCLSASKTQIHHLNKIWNPKLFVSLSPKTGGKTPQIVIASRNSASLLRATCCGNPHLAQLEHWALSLGDFTQWLLRIKSCPKQRGQKVQHFMTFSQ